jgi:cGMP-dependent protein kinase
MVRKVYLFSNIPASSLDFVIKKFDKEIYNTGNQIIVENDFGSKFFIIEKGAVIISQNGKKIREIGKFEFFGERALFYEEKRTATVTAKGKISSSNR